jgi:hypothetical protein
MSSRLRTFARYARDVQRPSTARSRSYNALVLRALVGIAVVGVGVAGMLLVNGSLAPLRTGAPAPASGGDVKAEADAAPSAVPARRPPARARRAPPSARGRPMAAAPARPGAGSDAAAPAELGTLRIEANVRGAYVFIDRQFVGLSPGTAEGLQPGTHQLTVSAEGYSMVALTIDVEPGPREVAVTLEPHR